MRNVLPILVGLAAACGSPPAKPKAANAGSGANNATSGTNGGNNSTLGSANNTTSPNDGTVTIPPMTTGPACEILTAEGSPDYCNLQATCGADALQVECEGADVWTCYCGELVLELEANPCETPEVSAPLLAAECVGNTGSTEPKVCEEAFSDVIETECSFGLYCGDDEYGITCTRGEEGSECVCYVNAEPTEEFATAVDVCSIGTTSLGWWNESCGWDLTF